MGPANGEYVIFHFSWEAKHTAYISHAAEAKIGFPDYVSWH